MSFFEIPDNEDVRFAEEQRLERSRRAHSIGHCAVCEEDVVDWEIHYEVEGELIHRDCVDVWLEKFKK